MKTLFFGLLAVSVCLISCKKTALENDYDRSYRSWLSFKKNSDNHYQYTKQYTSWIGSRSEYTITVKNGSVVQQHYKGFGSYETGQELRESWTEEEATLNTHHPYEKALTLDEVYAKAGREWLKADPAENIVSFEAKNQGMISVCGFTPKNCADDCFNGISITDIKAVAR